MPDETMTSDLISDLRAMRSSRTVSLKARGALSVAVAAVFLGWCVLAARSPPTLPLTYRVGQVIGTTSGTWSGSPVAYRYVWDRCGRTCVVIRGAHKPTYKLRPADAGFRMQAHVTAINQYGSASQPTALTPAVIHARG